MAARASYPSLLTLPTELQSHIALHLALSSPVGPPAHLVPLLATHPALAATLGFEQNPALYAAILAGSWDIEPIERRFAAVASSGSSSSSSSPPPPLADAKAQAAELRQRWATLRAVREFGQDGARWLNKHGGGRLARERLERLMLDVFFLLTENDGRNLPHVFQWARLVHFNLSYHTHVMLPASVSPGYPTETLGHGLHNTFSMWLDEAAEHMRIDAALQGKAVRQETEDQTQEKMFVLRPFAFALHKYNPFFVPWNKLGFTQQQGQQELEQAASTSASRPPIPTIIEPPTATPLAVDNQPAEFSAHPDGNEGGIRVVHKRFGRDWSVKSNALHTSCVFGLLNALDRDPRVGGVLTDSSNSSTGSLDFIYTPAEAARKPAGRTKSFDPVSGTTLRRSLPIVHLGSRAWDNDVKRMLLCAETTSPGMRLADWRGRFEGEWQGSFAFLDFNGYRDMIGGDEQALFENCFGQQGQQLILHEEVVYVPRQQLGGTGPALHCGFPLDAAEPDVTRPCPYGEEDVPDEEGSEWVKEIRIYGTGRSNWGSFKLTGRVRAFDGLVMLLKEYASELPEATQATRGNWLYRGYVSADARFIGAWRDTFSPEDVRGYEGPFCLRKQAEAYLVPEAGSAVSDAAAAASVTNLTALRPFSAGGSRNAPFARAEVFATTGGVDALAPLSQKVSRPAAVAAALIAARPMPSSTVDWRAHQPEIVEASSSCDPNDPNARRLPFIYPGFNRDEFAAGSTSDDKPAVADQASEGWGTAIYNQVHAAFQSADVAATLPSIAATGRPVAYAGPYGMEALLTPPPDDSSSRKRRAPSPEREMTKAEGKRREFIKPPQCNRQRHTSIYNGNASVASVVGESIFEHECDETLGKPQCKPEDKAGPAEKLERTSPQVSRRLSVYSLLR